MSGHRPERNLPMSLQPQPKLTLAALKGYRTNIAAWTATNDPAAMIQATLIKRQLGMDSESARVLDKYITVDEETLELKDKAFILSKWDEPVIIQGPTGTGKEMLARGLHGTRVGKFVDVNCAAIPANLVESELFGHEAGAFTGAHTPKAGLMSFAENGTLFLDEVGELPLEAQAKMLRAIQEKVIRKVGGRENLKINCRIVCATHRDLEKFVDEGKFREDLLGRLNVFTLKTKCLKDRLADIPPICKVLNPLFPAEQVNWAEVNLRFNVRSLAAIIKTWEVFGELPNVAQ